MTGSPSHTAAPSKADTPVGGPPRSRKVLCIVALLLVVGSAVLAWYRVGILDLPAVPRGLTLEAAGLANLEQMKQLNALIWYEPQSRSGSTNTAVLPEAARLVQSGVAACRRGDTRAALDEMRRGIRLDPNN